MQRKGFIHFFFCIIAILFIKSTVYKLITIQDEKKQKRKKKKKYILQKTVWKMANRGRWEVSI